MDTRIVITVTNKVVTVEEFIKADPEIDWVKIEGHLSLGEIRRIMNLAYKESIEKKSMMKISSKDGGKKND